MIKYCFVLVTFLALGAQASSIKDKLVGAKDADIGEFPYMVSIRSNNKHFCGGTLITKKHVLSAAHSIFIATNYLFGNLTAVVGTNSVFNGGNTYRISHLHQHPQFEFQDLFPDWMFDIGVFTLATEVEVSNLVGIARLPTKDVETGSEAVVTGWGTIKDLDSPVSPTLRKLKMKIIDQGACQEKMSKIAFVDQTHICTHLDKGYGSCSGDSGGPLVQGDILVGVLSGGIPCAQGYPDVFTNIYKYLSYVNDIIGKEE